MSNLVVAGPPLVPPSLGWSSKTVLKSFSEVAVRNPISALGCRPYRTGDSGGRLSVM